MEVSVDTSSSHKLRHFLLLSLFLAVLAGSAALVWANFDIKISPRFLSSSTDSTKPLQSSSSAESSTPQPVASASAVVVPIDKSALNVEVLNATTTLGLASSLGTKLKAAGFNVVKTSNAAQPSTKNVILFPTGQTDQANLILTEVIKYYASTQTQEDTGASDFQVIIGKQ